MIAQLKITIGYYYQYCHYSPVRSAKKIVSPPFYVLKSEPQGT